MNRPPLQNILYVEDNPNIRTLAKIALERLGGFSMHACESGTEALAAVEAGMKPDLLLLDVMLPGMDGPTILEHLRRLPQTAQTPVIFMTAKAQSSEIAHFMSLGALGVITKPFQPTLLAQEIRTLWNGETPEYRTPPGMQHTMDAFRNRFLTSLPKQVAELAGVARRMEDRPGAEDLSALHHLLHGLSGTAGTFGFGELGDRARQVEEMAQHAVASGNTGAALTGIADALKNFLRWCEATVPETLPAAIPVPEKTIPSAPPAASPRAAGRLLYLVGASSSGSGMASQLAHFGHQVTGIDGIGRLAAAVEQHMPAAIVIDTGTAEDVLASCDEIETIRKTHGALCPVIMLGNCGDFSTRLAAARAGVHGYLRKPVDASVLTEMLGELAKTGSGQPYRILIVDDDMSTAEHYKTILKSAQIEAAILNRPEDIFQTLERYRPELIVMDLYMPECSGTDLSGVIRQDKAFLDVPIVFLSNEHDLDRQAAAIRSGADYFLTKPITPERLVSALSSRAERYRSLRGLIMRDGLTGLYNHAAIKEHLQREIARARRAHLPLSIAMIDLDHFKTINDAWGHPAGDQVIRALARLMQQRFRRSDLVGRYGGEEFMVVLPSTAAAPAFGVLDDIRKAFAAISHRASEMEFTTTFSAGIAELGMDDDCDSLVQAADAMLYRAKDKGRNCVEAK